MATASRALALRPGIELGPYPEKPFAAQEGLEVAARRVRAALLPAGAPGAARRTRFVARVDTLGEALAGLSAKALRAIARDIGASLAARGLEDEQIARAFALVRAVSGQALGMRHHPCQLVGGWLIARGMLAEMQTGEGKTLTASLPACVAALAGAPVHVVTANDYLARRDAEEMAPLYRALGLTVDVAGEGDDPDRRRQAYRAAVTYCTAKQLAFDYLHDRLLRGTARHRWQLQVGRLRGDGSHLDRLMLRGLCFAIVDEADSIFIDEARTPLILSRSTPAPLEAPVYAGCLELAGALRRGAHYTLDARDGRLAFTDAGRARLTERAAALGGVPGGAREREHLVRQALAARLLLARDRDYIVDGDRVVIVDPNTGRPMPDRAWEDGLHQMVEAKEGCPVSGPRQPLARTSFQRFFRRYLRVGGMSGTLREVSRELHTVFGLPVASVAPHRPCRRRALPAQVFATREARRGAVVARVRAVVADGRPVLIGTRSVAESEALSARLDAAGIAHQVLNARQDRHEAEVVARAGEPGRVTVATNMAGRGTDIRLAPGVAARGGLHVIVAECNDAARVDRQLVGRAARQGEPGSHEALLALDDPLVERFAPSPARRALARLAGADGRVPRRAGLALVRAAQRAVERRHAAARRALERCDEAVADALAFAGTPE